MYKTLTFILLVAVGGASFYRLSKTEQHNIRRIGPILNHDNVRLDFCPQCIDTADQLINILLNLVLDVGVLDSCAALSQAVLNKTGSESLALLCDLACDVVGIDEYVKLIEKLDLDSFYYCELVKLCPINDNGDANFTQFTILPAVAPQGTTFAIDFAYMSVNGTGTGEIVIIIHCVDRLTLGATLLFEAQKPGQYGERIAVPAQPDPECDPDPGPCEQWLPGNYNVTIQICNGECGSQHPHSSIYATAKGTFAISD